MGGGDSGRRRVDGAAKAVFLAGLRQGLLRDEAAARAGFSSESFYYARRRDNVFKLAWIWAIELCAFEERESKRAAALAEAAGEDPVQPTNQRLLQRRRKHGIAFTEARKQAFLDHFAATADVMASSDAAGVHDSTAYKHRRTDPRFAAGWDDALAQAYAALEAEALRQRLEALRRARFEPNPGAESGHEFERVMKLLDRLDRQGAKGVREIRPGRRKTATFDDAMEELEKALRGLGVRYDAVPDEESDPDPW